MEGLIRVEEVVRIGLDMEGKTAGDMLELNSDIMSEEGVFGLWKFVFPFPEKLISVL